MWGWKKEKKFGRLVVGEGELRGYRKEAGSD